MIKSKKIIFSILIFITSISLLSVVFINKEGVVSKNIDSDYWGKRIPGRFQKVSICQMLLLSALF